MTKNDEHSPISFDDSPPVVRSERRQTTTELQEAGRLQFMSPTRETARAGTRNAEDGLIVGGVGFILTKIVPGGDAEQWRIVDIPAVNVNNAPFTGTLPSGDAPPEE